MMLLKLAWRNIWRNRNRSLITMSAIASAVLLAVLTVSLQQGVWDNLVKNLVSLYTGYAQVHAEGYWNEQTLENSFETSDSVDYLVRQTPGVTHVSHRLETFALASSGEKTRGCLVIGIDPEAEDTLTQLALKIRAGEMLHRGSETALLATGLAKKLDLGIRDTLVLLTQGYYGSTAAIKLTVSGLLRFGAPELNDRVAYVALPVAQRWLDAPGRATSLVLGLQSARQLEPVAGALRRTLPKGFETLTWEEMMPEITQHIKADSAGTDITLAVLYLLISFGIFSTLLMMLAERQREFGMLTALGMPPKSIARVVLLETVFLTICGCAAGILLSWPAVWYLVQHPIEFSGELAKAYERFGFEPVFPAVMKLRIFLEQTFFILFVGLVLAIYPVWRVLHINPVSAMRT